MTKEEKIKEAYEKVGLPFNENDVYDNGWMKIKATQFQSKYDLVDILKYTKHVHSIRPKSLQGIENNNGWTKINSINDLPKETDHYLVFNKFSNCIQVDYIDWDYETHAERWLEFNSHYKKIDYGENPLF